MALALATNRVSTARWLLVHAATERAVAAAAAPSHVTTTGVPGEILVRARSIIRAAISSSFRPMARP